MKFPMLYSLETLFDVFEDLSPDKPLSVRIAKLERIVERIGEMKGEKLELVLTQTGLHIKREHP